MQLNVVLTCFEHQLGRALWSLLQSQEQSHHSSQISDQNLPFASEGITHPGFETCRPMCLAGAVVFALGPWNNLICSSRPCCLCHKAKHRGASFSCCFSLLLLLSAKDKRGSQPHDAGSFCTGLGPGWCARLLGRQGALETL